MYQCVFQVVDLLRMASYVSDINDDTTLQESCGNATVGVEAGYNHALLLRWQWFIHCIVVLNALMFCDI